MPEYLTADYKSVKLHSNTYFHSVNRHNIPRAILYLRYYFTDDFISKKMNKVKK